MSYLTVMSPVRRKRWHLFPPDDTFKLYPTRIPYEESSVFSQVDVLHPDLRRFPKFQGARAHVVTLQPGQVRIPYTRFTIQEYNAAQRSYYGLNLITSASFQFLVYMYV